MYLSMKEVQCSGQFFFPLFFISLTLTFEEDTYQHGIGRSSVLCCTFVLLQCEKEDIQACEPYPHVAIKYMCL
jgi:hypothetical protein